MPCAQCQELRRTLALAFRDYEIAKVRLTGGILGQVPTQQNMTEQKRLLEDMDKAYTRLAAIDRALIEHRCAYSAGELQASDALTALREERERESPVHIAADDRKS